MRFLALIESTLPQAIDEVRPDLIIYNAGTDIYVRDPLGRLSISKEAIVKRDQLVFGYALDRDIPIAMVLSGGYTAESADIIAASIENLWHEILPKETF